MGIISDFMTADHNQLDLEWAEFRESLAKKRIANDIFDKFFVHLNSHVTLENEVLFKMFDEYLKMESPKEKSQTDNLYKDHQNLHKLLSAVKNACVIGNIDKAVYAADHFQRAMDVHRKREQEIPYKLFDTFIPKDLWGESIQRIYNK